MTLTTKRNSVDDVKSNTKYSEYIAGMKSPRETNLIDVHIPSAPVQHQNTMGEPSNLESSIKSIKVEDHFTLKKMLIQASPPLNKSVLNEMTFDDYSSARNNTNRKRKFVNTEPDE